MSVLGVILIVALFLVLAIALFFEIRSLVKSINQYKAKKSQKDIAKDNDTKEDK